MGTTWKMDSRASLAWSMVLIMLVQSCILLMTDGPEDSGLSLENPLMKRTEESSAEDFSQGGYNLLWPSSRWWQPSATRFNVTVNDSDGDGWNNDNDPLPNHPAIPVPQVPSNCADFRPVCSLKSEGFAGMNTPDYVIPHAHTVQMGLGDFDGDGDLDFARSPSNHKVSIYTNENGSSFSEEKYDWGHGVRDSTALAWADIDSDGDLDITSGNSQWTFKNTDQIFLNENGTYSQNPAYETADEWLNSKDIEWGLITDDPYPDMVVSGQSGHLAFYANFGDGFKPKPENYSSGKCYNSVATCIVYSTGFSLTPTYTGFNSPNGHDVDLADLDLDGDLDIVVGTEENAKLIRNLGFDDHDDFSISVTTIPSPTQEIAIGDLNDDGLPDVVVGGRMSNLKAYQNVGDFSFASQPLWESDEPGDVTGLELADMDNDGDLDLVAAFGSSKNGVFINRVDGLEGKPSWESEKSQQTLSLEVGDIDGDGDNDLIFGNADLADEVYLNHDRTVLKTPGWTDDLRSNTFVVKAADINNDGYVDLFQGNVELTADQSSSGNPDQDVLFFGTPDGLSDTPGWYSNVSSNTLDADWLDIDSDGDLDLYVGTNAYDMIFTNEEGNLSTDPTWTSPYYTWSADVEIADFNGDGRFDIVVADSISSQPSHIYLCCDVNGDPALTWIGLSNRSSTSVDVGDLDGDGLPDILFTNQDWASAVFHNDGTSTVFPENHTQSLSWSMSDAAIADLNADGCNDVVFSDPKFPNRITFCNGTGDNGKPTYRTSGSGWTGWGGSFDVEVGDMDADGDLDVIWSETDRPLVITIFENGAPWSRWKSDVVISPHDIEIADVTGDGGLDIIAAMSQLTENVVFESRTDGDGDWVSDDDDAFPLDPTQAEDWDGDGFGDHENGRLPDSCTLYRGDSWRDRWGCPDMDGDGQSDLYDAFITQDTQWSDVDGDGFGDNWYQDGLNETRPPEWPGQWIADAYLPDPSPFDFDNDGYEDSYLHEEGASSPYDMCPLMYGTSTEDRFGCIDSDSDGWSDAGDQMPNEPTQYQDSDGDGWGDDSTGMRSDEYPTDSTQWQDTDGDGYGDNQDGINPDAYPLDSSQYSDRDGDGFGDDSNGTSPDSCPDEFGTSFRDSFGCVDLDGDGWSNLSDVDDDNPSIWSDLDGDGFFDQPGFSNSDDCVNQAGNSSTPWRGCSDVDGDGVMDLADLDADGDGITNNDELQAGGAEGVSYDIYDASSRPNDLDGDGVPDALDEDRDGDGFPDDLERERGSNPDDFTSTPMTLYGDAATGTYYVPGEGFKSTYDSEGYEISLSMIVDVVTSEYLAVLLMAPLTVFALLRKRRRYKKMQRRLDDVYTLESLEEFEPEIDRMILKGKVRVEHGVLLRNLFERRRDEFTEEESLDKTVPLGYREPTLGLSSDGDDSRDGNRRGAQPKGRDSRGGYDDDDELDDRPRRGRGPPGRGPGGRRQIRRRDDGGPGRGGSDSEDGYY